MYHKSQAVPAACSPRATGVVPYFCLDIYMFHLMLPSNRERSDPSVFFLRDISLNQTLVSVFVV